MVDELRLDKDRFSATRIRGADESVPASDESVDLRRRSF